MKVGYKVIVYETGVIETEADLDFMLARGDVTPCCEQMRKGIVGRNIVFEDGVSCHFNLEWSEGCGEHIVINFCPFCGKPITWEETERVKMVNRPITRTIDNYVEEKI